MISGFCTFFHFSFSQEAAHKASKEKADGRNPAMFAQFTQL